MFGISLVVSKEILDSYYDPFIYIVFYLYVIKFQYNSLSDFANFQNII